MADSLIAKDKFILSYAVKKMNMKPADWRIQKGGGTLGP